MEGWLEKGAVARELGFDKNPFKRREGVASCSSFNWAQDKEEALNNLSNRGKPVVDEYGHKFSKKDFLKMLEECPVQYFDSIGVEFS